MSSCIQLYYSQVSGGIIRWQSHFYSSKSHWAFLWSLLRLVTPLPWYLGEAEGRQFGVSIFCCLSQEATKQNCCSQFIWALGQLGSNVPNQFPYTFSTSPFIIIKRQALQLQGKQAQTPHMQGLRTYISSSSFLFISVLVHAHTHTHIHTV